MDEDAPRPNNNFEDCKYSNYIEVNIIYHDKDAEYQELRVERKMILHSCANL